MRLKSKPKFDARVLLATVAQGRTSKGYLKGQPIFSQGDRADAVFFIQSGKVKVTVLSQQGKQAVIALLGPGDFFGEGCLGGQPLRMATATAMTESGIARVAKPTMVRLLHRDAAFSEVFTTYLLSRNIRMEEDLVDQLFNSSEKRLARTLLLLARYGNANPTRTVPRISQETLAEMIGATRSRVNFFMNKFRKLGRIEYNGGLKINTSLLSVVLHDSSQ